MLATFFMTVFYTQIIVEVSGTPAQALHWTDDHVAQGFAWSPCSAAFGLPDHDGDVKIVVEQSDTFEPTAETLWAVQTPFDAGSSSITISSPTGSEHEVRVRPGRYNLVFEALAPGETANADLAYVVKLHFIPAGEPSFAILKQGELGSDRVLRETTDIILPPNVLP